MPDETLKTPNTDTLSDPLYLHEFPSAADPLFKLALRPISIDIILARYILARVPAVDLPIHQETPSLSFTETHKGDMQTYTGNARCVVSWPSARVVVCLIAVPVRGSV